LPFSQAIDATGFRKHHSGVEPVIFSMNEARIRVVGGLGTGADLAAVDATTVMASCDMVEIRLDLLAAESLEIHANLWAHLAGIPLLFTARRIEEGGAIALDPVARMGLLRMAVEQASCIDIEVASISEMSPLIQELIERKIPWIASYHDFHKLPETAALIHAASLARKAGASVFKAAAHLHTPTDLARLADFQLTDHGLPVATMGMGPLAPVSRLLCAQAGSVLNYGFLGTTPTALGQWDSALLKMAISRLVSIAP
jgi:3-dehydroquinate dehydratase I